MVLKDVLEISAAALASLGGGGALVYKFSGFLGKLWADRALEEQRQKYAQLNLQLQSQLDTAARRLQVELDALGLVHRLRTKEEFGRLAGLWKRVANLRMYFNEIAGMGLKLVPDDLDARERLRKETREKYLSLANDAQSFLQEESLFIPKEIADTASEAIAAAARETFLFAAFRQHLGANDLTEWYRDASGKYLASFNEAAERLETLMRNHVSGKLGLASD